MQSLIILGRQPSLGIAELESLYGSSKIRPLDTQAVVVDVDPCLLAFDRLGGAFKFAKILAELDTTDWGRLANFLTSSGPQHAKAIPAGKMHLGISIYGFQKSPKQVQALAIDLKNAIRATGRSVRVVPNIEPSLSSAQVIHNRLTSLKGWELLVVKDGLKTIIAQTVKVQDIEAYAKRDQARPKRDAKVGMLPPKLAQVIINLSAGLLPTESAQSVCEIPPDQPIPKSYFSGSLLLDPFCGSGVILQEAAIMGYDCLGTDVDQRMVDYAEENLEWIKATQNSPIGSEVKVKFSKADARNYTWQPRPTFIATETYLGQPFTSLPPPNMLKTTIKDSNDNTLAFLKNIAHQLQPGTRLCLAIPAWQTKPGHFIHLPLLDSIEVIGYNRVSFTHARSDKLIYYRPHQVVARELLVLTKI